MASTRGVAQLLLRPEEMAQALGIGRTTVFELMRRASCGR
jgi:predicted DNA-binding transcriptional regulator AlpA